MARASDPGVLPKRLCDVACYIALTHLQNPGISGTRFMVLCDELEGAIAVLGMKSDRG
ncbi:MAG: hypothetical protein AAGD25_11020 [Cyanobacteria bacterium P01_F01_bin.150]